MMNLRTHTPPRRLRDIRPGQWISTPRINKGFPVYFGAVDGGYGLIWAGNDDQAAGLPWSDMLCLGAEAKEVNHA